MVWDTTPHQEEKMKEFSKGLGITESQGKHVMAMALLLIFTSLGVSIFLGNYTSFGVAVLVILLLIVIRVVVYGPKEQRAAES